MVENPTGGDSPECDGSSPPVHLQTSTALRPDVTTGDTTRVPRRRVLRAAVAVSGVGTAGCGGLLDDVGSTGTPPEPSEEAWPMFAGNHRNTGNNGATTRPTDPVEPRWTFDTGGAVRSSPAVVRGTVYVGSDDGHVHALAAGSGEVVWTFETGDRVRSPPTVAGNVAARGLDDVV